MSWEAIAAFALLGITVVTSLILMMRGLAKIESSLRKSFEYKIDAQTIKHQELELYVRDNYVETSSFDIALGRIEKTIDGMDGKIDTLMSRDNRRLR